MMTLDQFKSFILSPYWWISVLVAGILANLLTSAIRAIWQNILARISSQWRSRMEAHTISRQKTIERLLTSSHEQTLFLFDEMRNRLQSIVTLVIGGQIFSGAISNVIAVGRERGRIPVLVMLLVGLFTIIAASGQMLSAFSQQTFLRKALAGHTGPKNESV